MEPFGPGCVTVVTATRGRGHLLRNALQTVTRQCCDHVAGHLVLVDDCPETTALLARERPAAVRVVPVPRREGQTTGVYRLAELRDLGADLVDTPWLAYLDDDNTWEPDHLHTLLATAERTGAPAVHSWRVMTNPDGSPYRRGVFPWARDEEAGRAEYRRRVDLGAIRPGDPVYRDGARTEVDGGEWLLATELVRRVRFECVLEGDDWIDRIGEDDKFLEKLTAARVPIACTERPTLRYRLGGDSNLGYRGPSGGDR